MPQQPRSQAPSVHTPVLLRETIASMALEPGLTVVDGTVGGGGHSREVLRVIGPSGTLIGLDRDAAMLKMAALHLSGPNVHLRHASYTRLPDVLAELRLSPVDRVLVDLGWASDQLADSERGFSFLATGPLDLRFDVTQGEPAWSLLERLSETELAELLQQFGEDPLARRHARQIVSQRARRPLRTAQDLVAAVCGEHSQPRSRRTGARHPATQVFQALRIAINDELGHLATLVNDVLFRVLKPGGIAAVISFHSLEDRLVKNAFREVTRWQLLNRKPLTASPAEQRLNPRSRSARLRLARRN